MCKPVVVVLPRHTHFPLPDHMVCAYALPRNQRPCSLIFDRSLPFPSGRPVFLAQSLTCSQWVPAKVDIFFPLIMFLRFMHRLSRHGQCKECFWFGTQFCTLFPEDLCPPALTRSRVRNDKDKDLHPEI